MRFTVSKTEIQEKLSDIKGIVVHDKTMPILSHFLLNVSKDDSYIIATDLETTIKEPLHIDLEAEGKLCMPARKLIEIIKEVEDKDLSFESAASESPEPAWWSDKWLKVKSGNSEFKLICLPADDFPVWPALGDIEDITIDASTLMEMIEKTIYPADENKTTRYTLNGLLFHLKPDKSRLRLVGTDGIRLAAVSKQVQTEIKEERKIIVSRKAIFGLKRLLGRAEAARISIGANHVLFSIGDVQFLTRLVEGAYPDYEGIILKTNGKDKKKASVVSIERDAFIKALNRVSVMSETIPTNIVKLDLTENLITLSSSDPNIGNAKDQVITDYKGDGVVIAFNTRYLLDALKVMTSEKVILRLEGPLAPTLLTQQNDKVWKYIVMPVKI